MPLVVRPSSPLPVGMDKIHWQSRGHVYWLELTEPTFSNLLVGIDKTMTSGVGFHMLIGATGQGTCLLQDDPEVPLPLAEMIRITNSRLVPIWWSLNLPSEPMDLLFCCYRSNDTEDSACPPRKMRFALRDNWGPTTDTSDEGPPVAMIDRAQMSTSWSHPVRWQSEPPHQGPSGAAIPQKRLGEHTGSIEQMLANQCQSLLVPKLLSLVVTWALVF